MPETGRYRHYKGGLYDVLLTGVLCADTGEPMVVYQSVATQKLWVREAADWSALVTHPATKLKVPRFEKDA